MSKGAGSTTQKTEPWTGLQPFLTDAYAQAKALYHGEGPQYYPGQTYVPFSQYSQLGIDKLNNALNYGNPWMQQAGGLASNLMGQGSAYTQQAGQTFGDTASGNYLNANPYLNLTFKTAADNATQAFNEGVLPGLNATFGASGRTGGGAHALAAGRASGELADSLTGMAADIYGGNYQAERDRMMQAAQGLQGVGAGDVQQRLAAANLGMGVGQQQQADYRNLIGLGGIVEGKQGEALQSDIDRFNYYQNLRPNMLTQYTQWLNGLPGGSAQNITQSGAAGSRMGGALGGALVGAGMPGMLEGAASGMLASSPGMAGMLGGLSAIPGWGWALAGGLAGLGLLS